MIRCYFNQFNASLRSKKQQKKHQYKIKTIILTTFGICQLSIKINLAPVDKTLMKILPEINKIIDARVTLVILNSMYRQGQKLERV